MMEIGNTIIGKEKELKLNFIIILKEIYESFCNIILFLGL